MYVFFFFQEKKRREKKTYDYFVFKRKWQTKKKKDQKQKSEIYIHIQNVSELLTRRADNPEWVSSKSNTGAEYIALKSVSRKITTFDIFSFLSSILIFVSE